MKTMRDFEFQLIDEAVKRSKGNKGAAARLLGLRRTTLVAKLRRRDDGPSETPVFHELAAAPAAHEVAVWS
jgi:DNA-binding NtrC family response regulator